jgi:hypothetical protein
MVKRQVLEGFIKNVGRTIEIMKIHYMCGGVIESANVTIKPASGPDVVSEAVYKFIIY